MTYSLAAASVSLIPPLASYTGAQKHKAGETAATAINIGNLEQQSVDLTVSDKGTGTAGQPVTSSFTLNVGDTLFLGSSFTNFVDQATTRVQITDGTGATIADNQGSAAQQAAYDTLVASGLTPGAGTYTITATPIGGAGAPTIGVQTVHQQGTSLNVNSQLTGADPAEYYNLSLGDGNNIKLAFDAGSSQNDTRIQLYNSSGALVADSGGDVFQQAQFNKLISGSGLPATAGNYTVKVSYAPGVPLTQSVNYNFQLYSGSNYAVVYNNNVTTPAYDGSAAGSVTATSTAQLYTRQGYNTIGATAQNAVNIGWLYENKSQLSVQSQLTSADNADLYQFTFQQGSALKLGYADTTKSTGARVQLLSATGTVVIADNEGTLAQKAAFAELTSATGLAAHNGQYIVKVSYGQGASGLQNYNFQLYSGTSYSASYQTTASAQTYGNAVLTGNPTIAGAGGGASGIASYLQNLSQGTTPDLFTSLSKFV